MLGLKGIIGVGVLTLGVLVYAMWLRGEVQAVARDRDNQAHRANVATKAASENAEEARKLAIENAVMKERDKSRAEERNRILAEKRKVEAEMAEMREKFYGYLNGDEKERAIAARAIRADANGVFRELGQATCRADCEGGAGKNRD